MSDDNVDFHGLRIDPEFLPHAEHALSVHGVPPEVPATSNPKRYSLRYGADGVEFATAQEAMEHPAWGNQDNMLVPVAEVPADEGTLPFTPSTAQVRAQYIFAEDGEWRPERGENFDRWFATELQKARADELDKLAQELPPSPQRAALVKRAAAIRSQEPPTEQEQP